MAALAGGKTEAEHGEQWRQRMGSDIDHEAGEPHADREADSGGARPRDSRPRLPLLAPGMPSEYRDTWTPTGPSGWRE
jgi:hypothetical protein